jgi:acetoin:2,6-dichlorophenolindophenol oxidoreductase subunit alpha
VRQRGGIVPDGAGIALVKQLDARDRLSVVFIDDGTLGESVTYETLRDRADRRDLRGFGVS